ncbi:MAG: DUF4249 family protein [Cytophagales bacterium]|nr:MAG: hypothetical protein CND83_05105 [Rhodothermaeota bacterium MED-G19]
MKKIFGLLIIILFSCDNEIPIEDNFVVEAFLFQGEKVDDVRIKETKLWNSEDSIDTYIGNANIKIYGNGSEYSLEYNSTEGNYFIEDDLEIISGNTYGLEVNVDDRTATAETVVPTKPIGLEMSDYKIVIPPLVLSPALPNILAELFENARTNITWGNSNKEYHYLTIKYAGEDEDPIFSEEFPGQVGEFFSNFSIQSAPTQEKKYNVICMSLKNYGKYKVTLYKINKDYYSLFDSELQDGTELNDPPSNIINAFGVFSAFASDTTSFEIVRE